MKSVQVKGGVIATESFGSDADPAIVMIMGATASMLGWPDELCTTLAGHGLQVIRFDHRDTGHSTTLPPGMANYAVEDMADDVLALMDAYNLTAATLMGMSLGGYIGQMIAVEHASRVRSLVLISAEPLGWDGADLPHISDAVVHHFGELAALDWADLDAVTEFLLGLDRLCAGSGQPFDETSSRARISQVLVRTSSPASMFNHTSLSVRDDWTGRFREIACPVLVIHGSEDPVLPVANGVAIAENLAAAELMLLEHAGHEIAPLCVSEIAARTAQHTLRAAGRSPRPLDVMRQFRSR